MEQLPPFHPGGWIHLRFSYSRPIVKVWSRYARVSLAYWTGSREEGGEKYGEVFAKIQERVVQRREGEGGVQVSRRWKSWKSSRGKEGAWMDFFFFLPRSSLLSSSIISFLRLYVFHGEIIFHANTKKRSILNFFKSNNFQDQSFLSARSVNEEYEMRHFKIISFVSNRWNDPRAIIFTPKGRKIPSTLLKVISNLRARTVPFSISRHLYFYQVSTDHHTLPPPWLINARDRSLNIFLEPVGIGGQGRNRLSLTLAVSHGVYTRA